MSMSKNGNMGALTDRKGSSHNNGFAYPARQKKIKLLWANPVPNTDFAPQKISINLDGYTAIAITSSLGTLLLHNISGATGSITGIVNYVSPPIYITGLAVRSVTIAADGVIFGDAANAASKNNAWAKPIEIIGLY